MLLVAIGMAAFLGRLAEGGSGERGGERSPLERPGDASPASFLITASDIEAAGPDSPYGALLGWWRALQFGDAETVRDSYVKPLTRRAARRELARFRPRFSLPVLVASEVQGGAALLETSVASAHRDPDAPAEITVFSRPATFELRRTPGGWKLEPEALRDYLATRDGG